MVIRQILIVSARASLVDLIFSVQEVHLDLDRLYETNALFYLFNSQNYAIYHREINPAFPFFACEYGLVKLNRQFFRGDAQDLMESRRRV